MATSECLMPDVCEARSSHGIFYRQLLIRCSDPVLVAAAQENRNAEEIAGRLKVSAAIGDSVLIDPSEKDPRHPITADSEERRKVALERPRRRELVEMEVEAHELPAADRLADDLDRLVSRQRDRSKPEADRETPGGAEPTLRSSPTTPADKAAGVVVGLGAKCGAEADRPAPDPCALGLTGSD